MKSIRDAKKSEREFFEYKDEVKYHNYCLSCKKECKQSVKLSSINCPTKEKAHTPEQYIKQAKKLNKDINTLGREIGVNSRTVKSMLNENQDMTYEVYEKLEKLLYK